MLLSADQLVATMLESPRSLFVQNFRDYGSVDQMLDVVELPNPPSAMCSIDEVHTLNGRGCSFYASVLIAGHSAVDVTLDGETLDHALWSLDQFMRSIDSEHVAFSLFNLNGSPTGLSGRW